MSYQTSRDFQEPIHNGNHRLLNGKLFYTVHERGYYVDEKVNLGELLAVVDTYNFCFNEELKKIFIDQVREISLEKADEWHMSVYQINRSLQHLKMHA